VVGGRCTGGAHRRKVKQGCREDRSDVWILASKVVRFGGRVQSEKQIILVTMGRSVTSSSRKEVIADVAGLFSLGGSRELSRKPLEIWGFIKSSKAPMAER
jgi:hypothetical protein